jgi:vacuolar-type H+-ATPase subunit H
MQLDGIKYFTSRKVTILADEPGSGKTAQAIVAADLVRDNNQKILVFTPNSLLSENWLGKKAKGPMFFCGHSKEQLVNVETKEELDEAINSPNIIWIIVKESTFTQGKKEADDLKNDTLEKTRLEAEKILEQARSTIAQETKEAEDNLTKKIGQIAVALLEKSLVGFFGEKEQKEIMKKATAQIQRKS